MLRVWGRRSSFNVQKVMWLIAELGLAHEHISAGGDFGELDTPDFLAMNPHGRVPVIAHDGFAVWESHTILRYLAAVDARGAFWSADPRMRSQAERWMDWMQTVLQPDFLTGIFWGYYRTPPEKRDWPAIREKIALCVRHFGLLETTLGDRPFLGGAAPSLADITIGTALYRYFELDIEHPDVPRVKAWYARLTERPAYREHVMIPFEDLRARLSY